MKLYYKDKILEPYSQGKGQDLWIGTVSINNHFNIIEVRDETKKGVEHKVDVIVFALNADENHRPSNTCTTNTNYDRAMKGI